MKSARKDLSVARMVALQLALAGLLALAGCGMPGAPLPPSLNIPQPVNSLSAARTGDEVALTWTMPRRNTDKMLLKEPVKVKVCRTETSEATCNLAGQLTLTAGAAASFKETLPGALATGKPRALRYFVELENTHGRVAGPSNFAPVVAGVAPPMVSGLRAEVRKGGVALRWTAIPGEQTPVRLSRKLLNAPVASKKQGPLGPEAEPAEQKLLVTERVGEARALDRGGIFGESYEYRAQRVARISADGETLELTSGWSEPVRIAVNDIFPPDAPVGLAAVAAAPEMGAAIDLNWQPNTEPDLAGYIVYRCEGDGPWQRASTAKPLAVPAFHDTSVQAGHTYRYAVSAVDQGGRESKRSAETEETVPAL
ncbi:MAG: fibronectin type III domain-containing protein [Terracidiphilus sp.]|nr:fibronectin type III domain-containing protein [Terracidiphilus sp.]